MGSIISALVAIGNAVARGFEWATGRSKEKNRPEIVQNKEAAVIEKEAARIEKDVAEGDIEQLRKDFRE